MSFLNPNCVCSRVPRLKTDEEIIAAFREEMKEELEAIEGTPEQAELLDQLHQWVCPHCGYTKIGNSKKKNADEKCPVCGKSSDGSGYPEPDFKIADKEIIDQLQQKSNETWKKLTNDEKYYIKEYTDANYVFNEYLKGNDIYKQSPFNAMDYSLQELENEKINLDNSMKKFTLEQDLIVFRGTEIRYYNNRNVGETFTEKVLYSTTLNEDKAHEFENLHTKGPAFLEIRVPKGAECIYIGENTSVDNEFELLLNRETTYKMISKDVNKIILEVIL